MPNFTKAIHENDFFCGSQIRKLNLYFENHTGTFQLDLALHWWKEAKEDAEIPYSGYNRRGNDHRIIEYQFGEVSCVELEVLNCSNGDEVYKIEHCENRWTFELAGGTLAFHALSVLFAGESPCDAYGFQGGS